MLMAAKDARARARMIVPASSRAIVRRGEEQIAYDDDDDAEVPRREPLSHLPA